MLVVIFDQEYYDWNLNMLFKLIDRRIWIILYSFILFFTDSIFLAN